MANLQPTKIKVRTVEFLRQKEGPNNLQNVLNRLAAMPDELPSKYSYVRVDGLNASGEFRHNWDWDAPFGWRVGD